MRPGGHARLLARAVGAEGQHVAVLGQQHAVGGQARLPRPAARAGPACGTRRGWAPGSAGARGWSSSTRSSWLPWPETWTRGRAAVHHVAAAAEQVADDARDRALVAGDRRARRARPCRPGPTATSRCSSTLISGQRGERLALAAGHEQRQAPAARARGSASRRQRRVDGGDAQQAQVRAPPRRCPPCGGRGSRCARPALAASVGHALDARDRRWRSRRRARARACARRRRWKAGSTSSSPPVRPRCSTLVLSESSASTPRSPQAASASRSVRSSGGACGRS